MTRSAIVAAALFLFVFPASAATWIDTGRSRAIANSLGVDRQVDYRALVRRGPWDDRNYRLTQADLALLPEDESVRRSPIPVFFRIVLRREAARHGAGPLPAYPLSALNVFRQNFGGYLVDGRYYHKAVWRDGQYFIVLDSLLAEPATGAGTDVPAEVRVT